LYSGSRKRGGKTDGRRMTRVASRGRATTPRAIADTGHGVTRLTL
jgi:hypothetical protein